MQFRSDLCAAVAVLLGIARVEGGSSQLVISGNENKVDLITGTSRVLPGAPPDTLSLLDFASFPPRVRHLTNVSNTVLGPPSNIAIPADASFALIADSVRLDATSPTGWQPAHRIHVLDLSVDPPRVASEVEAGNQPSGLSLSRDGRLALVANRAGGSISVLELNGPHVVARGDVVFATGTNEVSDVAISPDGKFALASVRNLGHLRLLRIDGREVTVTERKISVYGRPYRVVISPDGRFALTAGEGFGNGLDEDAMTIIDLTSDPIRAVDYVPIGHAPESIELSPDGKLVAAVLMNGSNLPPGDPLRRDHGELVLLARRGKTFVRVQSVPVGQIPEGVAFTPDGRHLVVQCHPERKLWVFAVKGSRLRDTGLRVDVPGFPSSIRAAGR